MWTAMVACKSPYYRMYVLLTALCYRYATMYVCMNVCMDCFFSQETLHIPLCYLTLLPYVPETRKSLSRTRDVSESKEAAARASLG